MKSDRLLKWFLYGYLALVLVFIFAPIIFSIIFSFNSDRFPTIPLAALRSNGTKPSGRTRMCGKRQELA